MTPGQPILMRWVKLKAEVSRVGKLLTSSICEKKSSLVPKGGVARHSKK
jgi:hypothetical protein